MKIHWLQHVLFEGLGTTEQWALENGHDLSCTRVFAGEELPSPDSCDMLIVMGGPMGTYEGSTYRWLNDEKRFIEQVMNRGKLLVGVCLGAQIFADVLGARVYLGSEKEIGWFPVQSQQSRDSVLMHLPDEFMALQWHGDTFDLPSGAQRTLSGTLYENQGFSYEGRMFAYQCHLELGKSHLDRIIDNVDLNETSGVYVQSAEAMVERKSLFVSAREMWFQFLSNLVE